MTADKVNVECGADVGAQRWPLLLAPGWGWVQNYQLTNLSNYQILRAGTGRSGRVSPSFAGFGRNPSRNAMNVFVRALNHTLTIKNVSAFRHNSPAGPPRGKKYHQNRQN